MTKKMWMFAGAAGFLLVAGVIFGPEEALTMLKSLVGFGGEVPSE